MVEIQKDTDHANSQTCRHLTLLSSGGTGSSDNCWITEAKVTFIYLVFKHNCFVIIQCVRTCI